MISLCLRKPKNIGNLDGKKLGEFATPNNDYLRTPITQPTITAEDYEIKPHYLSSVQQNKFGGSAVRTQVCT